MISAPTPKNESQRLAALIDYGILDTDAEETLDELTRLAAEICNTPIALISLIDDHRQWFKSRVGMDAESTPRSLAFCAYTILGQEIFEVPDAHIDRRFFDNPLVTASPHVRFYAGTPLITPNGFAIGTLCVISKEAMCLDSQQRAALRILGKQVIMQLELRKKSQSLERAGQFKTDFLSSISHDIRTPLNAIVGFSDLLSEHPEKYVKDSQAAHFISNIKFSSTHLLSIVNSILDLSKIEAGKMELENKEFILSEFVDKMFDMLNVRALQKGVSLIHLFYADGQDLICLDEGKLSQVVTNLVDNAIKFTPSGRHVVMRATVEGGEITIDVEDEGSGIDSEEQKLIFDKFKQVGSTHRGGIGLGLHITHKLIQLMNGSIRVSSQLGKGTQVQVKIPLCARGDVVSANHVIPSDALPKLNILAVEDNIINQLVIEAMLSALGMEVTLAESGEAGLELLEQRAFDLVFMDIGLPGISGVDTTRILRERGHDVPVIALSADVFSDSKYSNLFHQYLNKPITKDKLKIAIAQLFV